MPVTKCGNVPWNSSKREIWWGDFNAHNNFCGSSYADVIEDLIDDRLLVCLNNGSGIRMNLVRHVTTSSDLTLVSAHLARSSDCKVSNISTVGSDHFPMSCSLNIKAFTGKRSFSQ